MPMPMPTPRMPACAVDRVEVKAKRRAAARVSSLFMTFSVGFSVAPGWASMTLRVTQPPICRCSSRNRTEIFAFRAAGETSGRAHA